ncbi:EamA family transporter [Amphritea pacifica]|uniref:EamA family transporter n=1 Tax=Amphritea pacifica TaxID=2811233 RepID=UPI001964504D|nr:EamA family transporter [Amphritea pacifica]
MSIRDLLLGIAVMCVWGFNFAVIKLGADHIDPLILTGLRFSLAVVPVIFFIHRPNVPWVLLIAYGLVFGVGVWGMVTYSITLGLSAGMASLLLQLNVAISLLIGFLFLGERITIQRGLGAMLALSGLLLSLLLEDGSVTLAGLVLVIIGATCWGLSSLIMKAAKTDQVFGFIVWGMLFAPLPLFTLSAISHGSSGFIQLIDTFNAAALFSILFQAYPTTLLGYWIWNRLIVKYPLSTVAPLTLLVPIFGLLGSVLFYQESIGPIKAVASTLIIAGLLVGLVKPELFARLQMIPALRQKYVKRG